MRQNIWWWRGGLFRNANSFILKIANQGPFSSGGTKMIAHRQGDLGFELATFRLGDMDHGPWTLAGDQGF